ncbi:hypothetical protein [Zavarzinella formosa]|uniref:hypothetical protein n=1 Tax=Zavarzinella formosa TaxID=360055 RepID=UPI000314ADE0|nr:hypothetical protein [Zavarzinella formosa]
MIRLWTLLFGMTCGTFSLAQEKSKPIDPPPADELAKVIRTFVLSALPTPLAEQNNDWGKQKNVTVGIKWEKSGILLKPKPMQGLRNDGTWRRLRVDADNPEQSLNVIVRNVQKPAPGVMTFELVVTLNVRIKFEQQVWMAGERVYSGETRARCRPILAMQCESMTKAVKTDSFFPDITMRMRILKADLTYDQLVVEHTAGVGGDLAKTLGKTAIDLLNQWKPSLQKNMLEKANQAIVKAGDTKEIKLGLGNLFGGK